MKKFTKESVAKVKNVSGLYIFYNSKKNQEYVGISEVLRHRLQSYYQKDSFNVHKTKKNLRRHIVYFDVYYMPIGKARKQEARIKKTFPHNNSRTHKK